MLGQVIPQTSLVITKALFQVLSIWLGQRKFAFKISKVIIINMVLSDKILKIVWGKFIQCFIDNEGFLFFYNEETASHT